jgi:hypothetical protein
MFGTKKKIAVGMVALALAACGGGHTEEHASSEHTAAQGSEHPATGPGVELHNACVLMMHRERECSDQFIPALVALRVRMDHPHGIAARDAAGHDALITEATDDYRRDSTDDRIAATCRDFAEHHGERSAQLVPEVNHCVAITDCQAFVDCDMQVTEERFNDRIQQDAAHEAAADAGTPPATTAH